MPKGCLQSCDNLPHQPTMWTFVSRAFQECLHVQNIQMCHFFPHVFKLAAKSDFSKRTVENFNLYLSISLFRCWIHLDLRLEAGPRFRTAGFLTISMRKAESRMQKAVAASHGIHGEAKALWISKTEGEARERKGASYKSYSGVRTSRTTQGDSGSFNDSKV